MKLQLLILLALLSFNTRSEIRADFNLNSATQIFTGQQPNDVATDSFTPNVGVVAESLDKSPVYAGVGLNFICEGDTFTQKWGYGKTEAAGKINIQAPNTTINTFANWSSGRKSCNLEWKVEVYGSKQESGFILQFGMSGIGPSFTISVTNSNQTPDFKEHMNATELFQMIKDPTPSGSPGSGC